MLPIGWWVLGEACRQLSAWQRRFAHHSDLYVSVNLSNQQLGRKDLTHRLRNVLSPAGLQPASLHIEVTESMVMERTQEVIGTLRGLRELGVHISLDDFGTGYSSLSSLRRLPDRQPEDRPLLRHHPRGQDRQRRDRARHRRPGPQPRAVGGRRGGGDRRAVEDGRRAGLRLRAGLPPRPPARRGGGRGDAGGGSGTQTGVRASSCRLIADRRASARPLQPDQPRSPTPSPRPLLYPSARSGRGGLCMGPDPRDREALGPIAEDVERSLAALESERIVERIWARDPRGLGQGSGRGRRSSGLAHRGRRLGAEDRRSRRLRGRGAGSELRRRGAPRHGRLEPRRRGLRLHLRSATGFPR